MAALYWANIGIGKAQVRIVRSSDRITQVDDESGQHAMNSKFYTIDKIFYVRLDNYLKSPILLTKL